MLKVTLQAVNQRMKVKFRPGIFEFRGIVNNRRCASGLSAAVSNTHGTKKNI